ncbi:hypothetical protein [Phocaeicola salanitronis]|uniref:hypothetical protein n=1 Tax=Phocaeicola salanitronis TaxID=376805 RepID=UPI00117D2001|nr:hypothetical protein [Phocaeicola salanitronis]
MNCAFTADSSQALGFHAAVGGKLSSFGISCCRWRQAFQLWDFMLPLAASFPALGFRAAVGGELSSFGISCRRWRQAFQLWDFMPPLAASFPALGFRVAVGGKLSSFGNPCCIMQETFQPSFSNPQKNVNCQLSIVNYPYLCHPKIQNDELWKTSAK